MLKVSKIFRRSSKVKIAYVAIINGHYQSFTSKRAMLSFIEEFGKSNVIHSLSMFKNVITSL